MRTLASLVAVLVIASAGPVSAASCRDAKGKFIPCPAAAPAATKCRDTKGKFIKCGAAATTAPGTAHP